MDPDYEKRIALALMGVIHELSPALCEAVDNLYKKFGVGGGIFWNRSLSGELAKKTRYEIISYLAALQTVLLEQWPSRTIDPGQIKELLEQNVFSMQLADARPAYEIYRERYYNKKPQDSDIFGREHYVHKLFIFRINELWASPESSISYTSALMEVTWAAENALRAGLSGVWPEIPGH